jgi:hypothetical protein
MAWPTTDDPKTEFVTVRFTVGEAGLIDASASVNGMSRSAYIRDCVRRVHAKEQRDARKLAGKKVNDEGPKNAGT